MHIIGIILGCFVILTTGLSYLKHSRWYIRGWDFPRLQLLIIAFVALPLLIIHKNSSIISLIVLCLLIISVILQIRLILPYTIIWKKEVRKAEHYDNDNVLSLLICNVYMDNKKHPACLEVALEEGPDVLLFVECDNWWEGYFLPLEEKYPHRIKFPLDNTYGMLVYSKYELIAPEIKFLIKKDIPSIHTKVKLINGKEVELYFVHPEPPAPGEASSSKQRDAELVVVSREIKKSKHPVIIGGDLNDVAWSHTTRMFQRISGLLDPRKGRGLFNSFHAKYFFMRWPLDHIFFSDHFSLIKLKKCRATGSDHFPIYVKVCLDGNGKKNSPPKEDEEDKKEANEKVQKAK